MYEQFWLNGTHIWFFAYTEGNQLGAGHYFQYKCDNLLINYLVKVRVWGEISDINSKKTLRVSRSWIAY